MPENYDYAEPARLLSRIRLSSYKTSLATQNDAQLFGAYCWNLNVVGAFYPLLQLVEVALRNALHNIAQSKYKSASDDYWFNEIPSWQEKDENSQLFSAEQVKKFRENLKTAKKSARKNLEAKGIANPVPTVDQVISQCDFSTWEYLLDKHFYNGSDKSFLWPHELTKVFRKLPRIKETRNVMFHQRDAIRRRIEEVRAFRNRISHNEPAWLISAVSSKQDVINNLTEKLDNMMELLFWISPKFKQYVVDVGIEARIRLALSAREMDRYLHSFQRHNIEEIKQIAALLAEANTGNYRCYFNVNGIPGILSPCNTALLQ